MYIFHFKLKKCNQNVAEYSIDNDLFCSVNKFSWNITSIWINPHFTARKSHVQMQVAQIEPHIEATLMNAKYIHPSILCFFLLGCAEKCGRISVRSSANQGRMKKKDKWKVGRKRERGRDWSSRRVKEPQSWFIDAKNWFSCVYLLNVKATGAHSFEVYLCE